MRPNICLMTDSYKQTHYGMYPAGTTHVYSYLESRSEGEGSTLFFGLQYLIKKYLTGVVVEPWMVSQAEFVCESHFGRKFFNREGWEHIINKHGGKLPVCIKAVPEGMSVPYRNVLMTIVNTDPKCYWLPNFLETLLMKVWYPITVATRSRDIKRIIQKSMLQTSDSTDGLEFKLHDFGYRGVSSEESAEIGGLAHLVNFKGTDTMIALLGAKQYYFADSDVGYSIPATEHSVMTALGPEGEWKQFERVVDVGEGGLFSIVADSYDIFNACSDILGEKLYDRIVSMDDKSVLVVRPDSGDPVMVMSNVLRILGEKFGSTYNTKGYKLLHPKIRVIQGDGVNHDSIQKMLAMMSASGWSTDNITFGMGGKLLQAVDRDTYKFAFKCSAQKRAGEDWRDVWKKPVTDTGKDSKRGRLALVQDCENPGSVKTVPRDNRSAYGDIMDVVFQNGNSVVEHDLASVRRRALREL